MLYLISTVPSDRKTMSRRRGSPTRPGATTTIVASRRLPRTLSPIHSLHAPGDTGPSRLWPLLQAAARSYPHLPPVYRHSPKPFSTVDSFPLARRLPRSSHPRRVNDLRTLLFRSPTRVSACVKRKSRRETLFSLRVAGRRGGSPGPYRRKPESNYRC